MRKIGWMLGMMPGLAWAAPAGPGAADFVIQLVPLIIIFLIFYFLLIRPQQKRIKQHQALVNSLKKGDKIVTGGGIYGTVVEARPDEEWIKVEIAQGVRVRVKRSTISGLAE